MFDIDEKFKDYVDKAIKLSRKDSMQYNNGEISDTFGLGHMAAGFAYLLMDLNLDENQMLEFESHLKFIENRLKL